MTWAILIVFLGLGAFFGWVSRKPNEFRLERSALIAAPAEAIRPLIEDFRRWPEWSPWEKLDPSMKRELSGAERGVGARYAWSGNGKAGQGRMEITGSAPEETLIALDFEKPYKTSNVTAFAYRPEAGGTRLSWTMRGPMPFMGKVMHTLFDMDKIVGKDFESGLAALKSAKFGGGVSG